MKYLKVWTNFFDLIKPLEYDEIGRLFEMMLLYAEHGEEPDEYIGNERFLWPVAKQQIDLSMEKNEILRQNGMKGGRPKAEITKENQSEPEETNGNQTKAYKEKKRKEIERKVIEREKEKESADAFEAFWAEYPNKKAKQDAVKAWKKLQPDADMIGKIMQGLKRWINSDDWKRDEGQRFIPYPATWLNGRRWEDDVMPYKPKAAVSAQNYGQRDYSGVDDEIMQQQIAEIERAMALEQGGEAR